MNNSEIINKTDQENANSGYDTLRDVPFGGESFIGPIPEDLKDAPENIARICLKERQVMNNPENRIEDAEKRIITAYNLFAKDEKYHTREGLNKKTPGFKDILDSPDFWQQERAELQNYGITRQFENAVALSESMRSQERERGIPPTIYMLSGISAAGKTTACRNVNYPGMIYETGPNNRRGDPVGPLATDNSKSYLWMAGGSCDQIHAESSMMMRKVDALWAEYVRQNNGDCSEVRDKTFSAVDDIKGIIKDAQETGRRICDLDIDVPFIVSAVGVMMRPKGSHEPHPGFDYLRDNFAEMRKTRKAKVEKFYPDSGLDVDYSLLCYDYNSSPKERQKEVARYEKGPNGEIQLIILDQELFNQAVVTPEDSDICREEAEAVGDQLVTPAFIEEYCQRYINPEDEDYINVVRKALSVYVDEENPKQIRTIIEDNAQS